MVKSLSCGIVSDSMCTFVHAVSHDRIQLVLRNPNASRKMFKWLHFDAQCVIVSSYRARQTVDCELRLIAVFLYLHLQRKVCAMS